MWLYKYTCVYKHIYICITCTLICWYLPEIQSRRRSNLFGTKDLFGGRQSVHRLQKRGEGEMVYRIIKAHYIYRAFLLSHHFPLRSSGIRIQRMGIPALEETVAFKLLAGRGKLEWARFGRAQSWGSRVSHRWVATFPRQRKQLRMPMKPEMTSKTHERHEWGHILKIASGENTNIRDGVTNNNEGCQN